MPPSRSVRMKSMSSPMHKRLTGCPSPEYTTAFFSQVPFRSRDVRPDASRNRDRGSRARWLVHAGMPVTETRCSTPPETTTRTPSHGAATLHPTHPLTCGEWRRCLSWTSITASTPLGPTVQHKARHPARASSGGTLHATGSSPSVIGRSPLGLRDPTAPEEMHVTRRDPRPVRPGPVAGPAGGRGAAVPRHAADGADARAAGRDRRPPYSPYIWAAWRSTSTRPTASSWRTSRTRASSARRPAASEAASTARRVRRWANSPAIRRGQLWQDAGMVLIRKGNAA